jgi:radical SAM protein with 4Fe4S-binding SPASM domain
VNPDERIKGLRRAPVLLAHLLGQSRYDFVYDQLSISVRGMGLAKRWNLLRAGLNLAWRRAQPWAMPLHVQIELSSLCNLRCSMCPTGNRELQRPGRFMETDLFRRLWDELGPYLLTCSLWAWGESLLHPRFREILAIAERHPVVTMASTNGQVLDREPVLDALLAHPPTYLIVALDGLSDETNAQVRVGARLAPALAGVEYLAREKRRRGQRLPVLILRTIAMKHNQHELPRGRTFAAEHGFDVFALRSLATVPTPAAGAQHDRLIPDAARLRAYEYRNNRRLRRDDFVCMQPFWFPSVFADGTVVACEQDVQASRPLGRVAEGIRFSDLWRGAAAAELRREIRGDRAAPSFCRDCPARDRPRHDVTLEATCLRPGLSPLVLGEREP